MSGDAPGLERELQALGLSGVLEPGHAVRSNRESGTGRPDVLISPRRAGEPGVVLALKVAHPGKKTLDQALDEGARQIAEKDYMAELRAASAEPIHALVVAFDGKQVRIRSLADSASR